MELEDKMIHIPVSEVTEPIDGSVVMLDRWWTVHKEGHISIYTGRRPVCKVTDTYATYTPQCNRNEQIANRHGTKHAVFIPVVYFVDKISAS
jgi:hypothetical protein